MPVSDVSILIVSFNTRDMTLACLSSVYRETREIAHEVIVVDNCSQDESATAIAEQFPAVRLIQSDRNLGFALANNLAAKVATGRYLLLLNPDTVILNKAIQRLVAFADQHPDAGLYGGRTVFEDGRLNRNSCHGRPTPWSLLCMGLGLSAVWRSSAVFNPESLGNWNRDSVRAVDAVTGCFLLIRREVWDHLDGFDPSFFMYGEDTDLCLRAGRLGSTCLICPDAAIVHYGGASEKVRADKMARLFRAKAQLIRRHWSPSLIPFGVAMLDLWALTRTAAFGLVSRLKPEYRQAFKTWREVWCQRCTWHVKRNTTEPVCQEALTREKQVRIC
ncbi:MAG: glycosyltransferase family 2 protein [Phycisphaerae bacterium]|nr:glycosyltransferase family 2 protein [Phycisphaerae bacterium]